MSAVGAVHSSTAGPGAVVHTTGIAVDAFLPWMEVASATDAPEFDRVLPSMHPPWLRAALRHSCLYEDRRFRTVVGHSWWPSTGAKGLDGHKSRQQSYGVSSGIYYERGPSEKPTMRGSSFASMVVVDPHTVLHGVRSEDDGDDDGDGSASTHCDDEWRHPVDFPTDTRLV